MADQGGGVYAAVLTAPAPPGGLDTIGATLENGTGLVEIADAATIRYIGPADPDASDLTADPRRIAADGVRKKLVGFIRWIFAIRQQPQQQRRRRTSVT